MKRPAYDQTSLSDCKDCGVPLDKTKLKGNRCMKCHGVQQTANKKWKRRIAILMKGDRCVDCKQTFPAACYDFHHEGDKKEDVATYIANNRKLETILNEASKCELLCACCHRLRHYS